MRWRSVVEFEHAGTTTHVHRLGPDTDQQHVLVHGIGMGRHYLTPLAESLAGSGGVHVLELPGFGDAPTPDQPLTVEQLAAVVLAYVRRTGMTRPVLVGHSMGAQVVVEAALQGPDVVGPVVAVAGVVDPGARSAGRQGMRMLADLFVETPSTVAALVRDWLRTGPRRYLETVPLMLDYRTEEAAVRLPVPLLVVRGDRDPVAPHDWADQLTRLAPDGRLVEVPGAHAVMFTRPGEVAEQIVLHGLRGATVVGEDAAGEDAAGTVR
ncbi:alpha/beta fold hydrolase [uncultured Ornithinimicrobium sp.]|uniref:alpha/beta fold hydrolase n=1 Tax=uncultured Ornithinimicrobium sp. TaxID=259307 RepID=UPI0025976979|nr:alpha/beta hydrolase [uncultured Ornithinimicrobium sp.]